MAALRARHPADLRGKTVLDIGCNAGFYSLEMKRRGAERVVAIDSDAGYLAQARFAAEVCGVDIEFRADVGLRRRRACEEGSTSCCSWACSTTCAIRCWRSICCTSTWRGDMLVVSVACMRGSRAIAAAGRATIPSARPSIFDDPAIP